MREWRNSHIQRKASRRSCAWLEKWEKSTLKRIFSSNFEPLSASRASTSAGRLQFTHSINTCPASTLINSADSATCDYETISDGFNKINSFGIAFEFRFYFRMQLKRKRAKSNCRLQPLPQRVPLSCVMCENENASRADSSCDCKYLFSAWLFTNKHNRGPQMDPSHSRSQAINFLAQSSC